jgi:hypothetical protein
MGISADSSLNSDGFYLFWCELWRAATGTTPGAGCGKTRHRPLPDQVAFELGERGEDMEDETAGRRDGFDLFGKRFEVDLSDFHVGDEAYEIGQVPAEPVQPPHDERVSCAEALEAGFKLRSGDVLSRRLFFVDLPALGSLEGVPL